MKNKLIEEQPFKGKLAIIPGGSKGMGKAVAKDFIQLGGSVCIIARGIDALKETQDECNKLKSEESQFVEIISCDTTDKAKLEPHLTEFINKRGVPQYLFNFVGYAFVQYLEKLTLEDFKKNMNVNYYGQLVPTLILLPYFMKEKSGYITFTSSAMGFMAIMGYSTYCPSKFAVAGLAEVLRNELVPYSIDVSILYPVDTDTPGLEEENKLKPEECKIISEGGGLLTSEEVAETFIDAVLKKKFEILPGKAKMYRKLMRLFPGTVRSSVDKEYRKALKKTGRKI
ncbi:MAG: SDR family NAD(P)-dependent oxidoreductase [Candidatus Hermodarchaeota archaeon]